ncbi:MAG: hypothetical protein AAF614_17895 [Chloroflexota bacterium]
MTFQIGYTQTTITPSLESSVYLAGFGQNRRAQTVHDDLFVRALALTNGATQVVVLALDLIGYARELCQAIERRIQAYHPQARLLIACTHTHHGPDTLGLWGPDETASGIDPTYMAWLAAQIEATALTALENLRVATLRQTAVLVPNLAKNARDPHIRDEELTCLQFVDPATSQPLVSWLLYPCHPEVLWDDNPHITSDYLDAMRQTVEAATMAPCIGLVGALGGMMTPDVAAHTFAEAERMGRTLAEAALQSWEGCGETAVSHFTYQRHEFSLPLENPLFQMAQAAGLLQTAVQADGTVRTEASLLQLNNVWLFAVPGELFPKLGLAYRKMMKAAGGENTAVIGLANDEIGYILPAEDFVPPENHLEPGASYEESMSISAQAGPAVTKALRHLIGQLSD